MLDHIVRRRARLLAVPVILAFIILGLRLVQLQVVDADSLQRRMSWGAGNPQQNPRGTITDSTGATLALSFQVFSLSANPRKIENHAEVARQLSAVLGRPRAEIQELLDQDKGFVWVARRLPAAMVDEIRVLRLPHINLIPEYMRVYPNKTLASHVLGFVGLEDRGLEGIELAMDKYLRFDAEDNPQPKTVVLTIDSIIQHLTEEELGIACRRHHAGAGVAIVMDIPTGAILSMATYPEYDPNEYAAYDRERLRNRAVTDVFEPGSIFKLFVAASLLDNRQVTFADEYVCNRTIRKYDHTFSCYTNHGHINFYETVVKSCNVGMIRAVESIDAERLYRTLRDFGFGLSTGVELPGEVNGTLRKPYLWSGLSRYSMAIGYEVTVTPLQILSAAAALGNDGILMRPQIVREVRDAYGNTIVNFTPQEVRRVIRSGTVQDLLQLMRGVVREGTGQRAALEDFAVAGKTGTARLPNLVEGGYYPGRYIGSFIGIAPVDKPRLAILVSLSDLTAEHGYYGGEVAAPAFAQIAQRALDQLGVTPPAMLHIDGETVRARSTEYDHQAGVMPDLRGATLKEVIALLGADCVRARIEGSGRVVHQEPEPGGSTWSGEIYIQLE